MDIQILEKRLLNSQVDNFKCIIDGQECWVPNDPLNRHYVELIKQHKEGKINIPNFKESELKPVPSLNR